MKTLFLLRHAKSGWDDATLDDHDRPLNARGRKAAPEIGRWALKSGLIPDLILCSTSVRTRDTVALAFPETTRPPVEYDRELYLAPMEVLLARIQDQDDARNALMLVGHNPGLGDLAVALARTGGPAPEEARRRALATKFPTLGFAGFVFAVDRWRDVSPGAGQLTHFVTPKDL